MLSLFTGLCSTAGIAPYTDMFKAMKGVSTSFIGELSKSTWVNNKVLYISLFFIIVCIIYTYKKIRITDVFYVDQLIH